MFDNTEPRGETMVSKTVSNVVPISTKKPSTMGSLIDKMSVIRDQRRVVAEQDKKLKEEYDGLELQLMEVFDKQDTRKGEGKKASASVSDSIIPNVVDWDAFYAYILKNKFTTCFGRRATL